MSDLRMRVVEAGARAWCEANGHFFDSCVWEEQHLAHAALAVDAVLDCLTENADEWMNAATQESILDAPNSKDNVEYMVAVLREGDE